MNEQEELEKTEMWSDQKLFSPNCHCNWPKLKREQMKVICEMFLLSIADTWVVSMALEFKFLLLTWSYTELIPVACWL